MEQVDLKFKCPECDRAILNRKVNRCMYCGATLPAELLFSSEKIAELNEQERLQENRRWQSDTSQSNVTSGFDIGDAIDLASDIGGLFD